MKINIHKLKNNEDIPYSLLLLADETVEAINKYIFDSEIYVLENENDMIGVYALLFLDKDSAEIKNIAVDEKFQNKGFGKMMLKDASNRAKERGCKNIFIATADAGIKQLYIYQKAGYEMDKILKNVILDNYPEPIFENGIQLKHMVLLKKELS